MLTQHFPDSLPCECGCGRLDSAICSHIDDFAPHFEVTQQENRCNPPSIRRFQPPRKLTVTRFPLPIGNGIIGVMVVLSRFFLVQMAFAAFSFAQVFDWPQFGFDAASSGFSRAPAGIDRRSVGTLTRHQVQLDGTVDASAIYLRAVTVAGSTRDVFFVTTTYGKTIAIDADSYKVLWEYVPQGYTSWAATAQITTSTPAADPGRQYLYAASHDGSVQKLAIADGHLVWKTAITLLPSREKIASPLKIFNGTIVATTGGFIGDAPPYQGHVAILDTESGALLHVWNSLCSDRPGLIDPTSCDGSGSAIWGRSGAVVDSSTGNIFVATGNGPYDGKRNWGDSVIELSPDVTQILANYTPADNASLDEHDTDLGSTSPVLLGGGWIAQGGKDALIRLLSLAGISGNAPHTGNESQIVSTPGADLLFTAPAVWNHGGQTWIFAADGSGSAAWTLANSVLTTVWAKNTPGTSPVLAGGLLYIYNPQGGLYVYDPASGGEVAKLEAGSGHWNSPIVVDGRIALPEGNANQHATSGVFDIWTVSGLHQRTRG